MEIKKIKFAYFTPIQVTRRYVYCVAAGMSAGIPTEQFNLTAVEERHKQHEFAQDELLIAALPSFGGRVPKVMPELLRNLKGAGTPAALLVTYGNRGYDDTLLEMQQILQEQGFVVVGGAALVSVHALSGKVGEGRPDASDLAFAREFGAQIRQKVEAMEGLPEEMVMPGNLPLKEAPPKMGFSPVTNDKCVLCMQCFRWCPTGAITYNNPNETDISKCVMCYGCVTRCPVDARQVTNQPFLDRVAQLEENFSGVRCEPEMFV